MNARWLNLQESVNDLRRQHGIDGLQRMFGQRTHDDMFVEIAQEAEVSLRRPERRNQAVWFGFELASGSPMLCERYESFCAYPRKVKPKRVRRQAKRPNKPRKQAVKDLPIG
jgi:hypothetical protein